MGAIFGLVGEGSLAEVEAMGHLLAHRGPYQRCWSPTRNVYFGQAGHKPFEGEGSALTTDWQVAGDQDTLAGRLAQHGPAAIADLRGTFALAICGGAGQVTLAVDHIGYKSLYYAVLDGRLAFASEYKALLALTDLPLDPDRVAIQHYLATKHPLHGRSFLACARSLLSGQMLEWRNGRAGLSTYWQPGTNIVDRSPAEHVQVVRRALLDTVRRQVQPFERIGITLGGGIDAAIVLGAIRRVAPDVRISSFTIGAAANDWEILGARATASQLGTDHHEYVFDPSVIPADLPRLVWLTEDCVGREEAMLQMHVLRHAAGQTDAIFSGYNADMLFGGMPRHRLVGFAERLPVFSAPLKELFQLSQAAIAPSTLVGRALRVAVYGGTPPQALRVPGAPETPGVFWRPNVNEFICGTVQGNSSFGYLEPTHALTGASFNSPFVDPDMIAASLTVPGWLKTGWRRQKWVLREAADFLPASIRLRKKAIQRLDVHGAMGQVLSDLAGRWLVDCAIEQHRLLTRQQLQDLRRDRGRACESRIVAHRLWSVLSLECWARHFLQPRPHTSGVTAA